MHSVPWSFAVGRRRCQAEKPTRWRHQRTSLRPPQCPCVMTDVTSHPSWRHDVTSVVTAWRHIRRDGVTLRQHHDGLTWRPSWRRHVTPASLQRDVTAWRHASGGIGCDSVLFSQWDGFTLRHTSVSGTGCFRPILLKGGGGGGMCKTWGGGCVT